MRKSVGGLIISYILGYLVRDCKRQKGLRDCLVNTFRMDNRHDISKKTEYALIRAFDKVYKSQK